MFTMRLFLGFSQYKILAFEDEIGYSFHATLSLFDKISMSLSLQTNLIKLTKKHCVTFLEVTTIGWIK